MASDRQSVRNRENFYIASFSSQFRQYNKIQEKIFSTHGRRDTCFVQFLVFLTKFLSAEVTKFARFCKQKLVAGKICNARGHLPGDYGPPINQSEHAYYRSHIINVYITTPEQRRPNWTCGKVELQQIHMYSFMQFNCNNDDDDDDNCNVYILL